MAIYHFSAKVIGRSSGRSAVASAAYRAAECLYDEKLGRTHNYADKLDNVHREIMLPEGAAPRWQDRATLWNEVESGEKRKDAQLARDIEISLPRELGKAEAIRLARDFVREQFVDRGMVADLNVHWTQAADGEAQPHAHVMLTMREIVAGADGEGAFGKKVVAWNDRALLGAWRERWAELVNERMAELGHDVRIDHRSYAEQGIDLEPQHKIGPAGARRAERGEDAERQAEHDGIARRNGERIAADPMVALDALTRQHSTFTRQDLARFVNRHTDGAEQFADVMAKVEASAGAGAAGSGWSRAESVQHAGDAGGGAADGAGRGGVVAVRGRIGLACGWKRTVRCGWRRRVGLPWARSSGRRWRMWRRDGTWPWWWATRARARARCWGWRARGGRRRAIGCGVRRCPALRPRVWRAGSGIGSRTLASLEWAWKEGREADLLTSRDVLVVDEAGMVGSRQMERVLSAARAAGAKVVLVGDPEQLQAIEAGAAFRALAERHGAAEIGAVRRQREGVAARGDAGAGDGAHGVRRWGATRRRGWWWAMPRRRRRVRRWWTGGTAERRAAPEQSQVMLAYTRADVAALNELARERLRAAGELGLEQVVQTERGSRAIACGRPSDVPAQRARAWGGAAGPRGRGGEERHAGHGAGGGGWRGAADGAAGRAGWEGRSAW